jgi:hypothetical protein
MLHQLERNLVLNRRSLFAAHSSVPYKNSKYLAGLFNGVKRCRAFAAAGLVIMKPGRSIHEQQDKG